MAKHGALDFHLSIDDSEGSPVDLSDHVESCTINMDNTEIDITSMSDDSMARIVGLQDVSMDVTFRQDYSASEVDATLFAIWNAGLTVTVTWRPTSSGVSATNPAYEFEGILFSYPIGGSVNTVENTSITIRQSDGNAITRSTS